MDINYDGVVTVNSDIMIIDKIYLIIYSASIDEAN